MVVSLENLSGRVEFRISTGSCWDELFHEMEMLWCNMQIAREKAGSTGMRIRGMYMHSSRITLLRASVIGRVGGRISSVHGRKESRAEFVIKACFAQSSCFVVVA
jgi:hypothetical protein